MSTVTSGEPATKRKPAWLADRRRLVGVWLAAICVLIALMVIVGGATRLTDPGLSITEWKPVTGAVPPLSAGAWQAEFEKYKVTPEYRLVNRGMSLDEFKTIYWWEWGHRFLGRVIGLVFLVPFALLALTRQLGRGLIRRLILIFLLGGAQAVVGWYMVKSGLVDRVDVSQYRLAAHLGLAFVLFGLTLWTTLDIFRPRPAQESGARGLRLAAIILSALIFCQVLLGALVAGLRAGYRFNTWPLMEGRFVPNGAGLLRPFWRNFLDNPAMVQLDHRLMAYVIVAAALTMWVWARSRSEPNVRRALDLMLGAVVIQALLGIWTLVAVVPIALGLLHQAGALALLAASLNLVHVATAAPAKAATSSQAVPIRSLGSGS